MSDLIYKEYIKKQVQELNPCDYGSISSYETHSAADDVLRDVLRIIDDTDTAYDVNKVVEQLKERSKPSGFGLIPDERYISEEDALELVKKGGVE